MSEKRLEGLREDTKRLFFHGWDAYKSNAYPADELRPLSCRGQGHSPSTPFDLYVNDVLGDYVLTVVDTLDTLALLREPALFRRTVEELIPILHVDNNATVQVFESTIRVLGGLLSGHLAALDVDREGEWYKGELLEKARDLGERLLPAFQMSLTGIPFARVNLRYGLPRRSSTETCTAGATSLVLEFATLGRLTREQKFEEAAKKAFYAVWGRRSDKGLLGNAINLMTGVWMTPLMSSIGAGIDSFFEYALKTYILLGEDQFYDVFSESYGAAMRFMRSDDGFWMRGVNMQTGQLATLMVDSLSAFWPGLQVLAGDVPNAIQSHLAYYNLWRRYSAMPERFNTLTKTAEGLEYPLRPEFVESNYFLYLATKDDFYLEVAERILRDIEKRMKVDCGLASMKNIVTGELEDRMESFALSETLKYLYLTFDVSNPINSLDAASVFTTEGHNLALPPSLLRPPSDVHRLLRRGEVRTCPAYFPPEENGIVLGVRGRRDWDYARELSGLRVEDVEAEDRRTLWRPDGVCEKPVTDPFVMEILFTNGVPENKTPTADQVEPIERGFLVKQIGGLRLQITKRFDGAGYDVSKIGPYRVVHGQTVVLADPQLLVQWSHSEAPEPLADLPPEHVVLRFTLRPGGGKETASVNLVAATSTFGPSVYPDPLTSNASSSDFALLSEPFTVSVIPSNAFSCTSHHPRRSDDPPAVLVATRGQCTFYEKAVHAQRAGYAGVITLSDEPSLIRPSVDPVDEAGEPVTIPVLVLPSDGAQEVLGLLDETVEGEVQVQVVKDENLLNRVEHEGRGDQHGQAAEDAQGRILTLNGFAILNTVIEIP